MKITAIVVFISSVFSPACLEETKEPKKQEKVSTENILTDEDLRTKADSLAQNLIIVDTHIDVPYRLSRRWENIGERTKYGEFDYPRAKSGGLNAAFMSIYTPASLENTGDSKILADKLINIVQRIARENTDKFAIAVSVQDVMRQFKQGVISLVMGMENGSPIEGKLENLKYFYERGIRYITLAHSKPNHISDSSYDPERKWNGLSPFGEEVVQEMNRLGIMVDVSHITDSAFYDVLSVTKLPVIASHSSCRYFTPGYERNMSDEMIKALAKNKGVIQINFGSEFLTEKVKKRKDQISGYITEHTRVNNLTGEKAREFRQQYLKENHPGYADVKDVAAHIDHVVKLVGIDYVGLGSDFDGVGDSLPEGLKDVSFYPNLIYELLKAGYSDKDIEKICSGNILRVWSRVEQFAKDHNQL